MRNVLLPMYTESSSTTQECHSNLKINGFNIMGENIEDLLYLVLASTRCRGSPDTAAGTRTQTAPGRADRRAASRRSHRLSGRPSVWAAGSGRPKDHSAPPCCAWWERMRGRPRERDRDRERGRFDVRVGRQICDEKSQISPSNIWGLRP